MTVIHNQVGVIGGTKFDARLGAEFLKKRNIKSLPVNIAHTPDEQTLLQTSKEILTHRVKLAIIELKKNNCASVFIYCNSLSGAIDLAYLKNFFTLPIITPLDVYPLIAKKYNKLGLIAANCQALGNIEKWILQTHPQLFLVGFSSLLMVNSIETGLSAKKIIENFDLVAICKALERSGVQVVILGCTHFSYLYKKLKEKLTKESFSIPLFDPSEIMFQELVGSQY